MPRSTTRVSRLEEDDAGDVAREHPLTGVLWGRFNVRTVRSRDHNLMEQPIDGFRVKSREIAESHVVEPTCPDVRGTFLSNPAPEIA